MFTKLLENVLTHVTYIILIKKFEGVENLPKEKAFIVAANHTSYVDIWALLLVFYMKKKRYVRFIAKKELVQDWYVQLLQKLFLKPENKPIFFDKKTPREELFKKSLSALKRGHIVGIFPEGIRSSDGKIQKGKTGTARLALMAKVPIVPVGITGAFELMPTSKSAPKMKKSVKLKIGKPIYTNNYKKRKITKKLLREITDKIMKEIAKLSGQKYNP